MLFTNYDQICRHERYIIKLSHTDYGYTNEEFFQEVDVVKTGDIYLMYTLTDKAPSWLIDLVKEECRQGLYISDMGSMRQVMTVMALVSLPFDI